MHVKSKMHKLQNLHLSVPIWLGLLSGHLSDFQESTNRRIYWNSLERRSSAIINRNTAIHKATANDIHKEERHIARNKAKNKPCDFLPLRWYFCEPSQAYCALLYQGHGHNHGGVMKENPFNAPVEPCSGTTVSWTSSNVYREAFSLKQS